ncbi:methylated-DNA-[protein]-cysteine S-methyltransferase [Ureibacillus xyleni]|uniref:Methylated-DNA--protein-cysteine methyltransferase n=1 Tax=Ureibacillus xyleni TaxID=614648 RepID=A0A285SHH0_9BACL|nr:methylated-DNA--[protein]-cysteine S-methyltransferase [Ureibacillus xyleni]SOC05206.1 methylated-DNA-[protein]-cysteine S-methyltransferase [Ureibacillus xyleni]
MAETLIYSSSLIYNHWQVYFAATNNGLCFLGTHHSSFDDLEKWCKKQFPNARIIEDRSRLLQYEKELVEYFEGKRNHFSFPFDIRGTKFQMDVWKVLNEIPYGQTKCYSDIAKMIGNPKAVRAVGTAIGRNPLSIVIPCHRVLGKNGTLTGYSGGLDVKEMLLQHEGIPFK